MKNIILVILALFCSAVILGCSGQNSLVSPNGKYVIISDGRTSIALAKTRKIIRNFPDQSDRCSWLRDSSGLLTGQYHTGLFKLPVKGYKIQLLQTSGGNYDHNPTQSLDGEWVYFLHHEMAFSCTVYRIKAKTLLAVNKDGIMPSYSDCEEVGNFRTKTGDEDVEVIPQKNGQVVFGNYATSDPKTGKFR